MITVAELPSNTHVRRPTWAEKNFFGFTSPEPPNSMRSYTLFGPNLAGPPPLQKLKRGAGPLGAELRECRCTARWAADCDCATTGSQRAVGAGPSNPHAYEVGLLGRGGEDGDHFHTGRSCRLRTSRPRQGPMVPPPPTAANSPGGTLPKRPLLTRRASSREGNPERERPPFAESTTGTAASGAPQGGHAHNMSWCNAHFSEDLALHAIFDFTRRGGETRRLNTRLLPRWSGEGVHGIKAWGRARRRARLWYRRMKVIEVTRQAGASQDRGPPGARRWPTSPGRPGQRVG